MLAFLLLLVLMWETQVVLHALEQHLRLLQDSLGNGGESCPIFLADAFSLNKKSIFSD